MSKRSFSSQLPAIHQTEVWNKFFGATVDQVFSPGVGENQISFIGRVPPYNNPETDFYKVERDAERSYYQLEPAMTTRADGDDYSNLMFYQDLVNHLKHQGANTEDHNRLFSTEKYTWCPPVNIHKLTKFNEYYWMPMGPPVLIYDVKPAEYKGTGSQFRFYVPESLVPGATSTVAVAVDGDNVASGKSSKYYEKATRNSSISEKMYSLLPDIVYDTRNLVAFGTITVNLIRDASREAITHMKGTGWFTQSTNTNTVGDATCGKSPEELRSYFIGLQTSGIIEKDANLAIIESTLVGTRRRFLDAAVKTKVDANQLRVTGSYLVNIIDLMCLHGDISDVRRLSSCYGAMKTRENYKVVGDQVLFTVSPSKGQIINVWGNANFKKYVDGAASFRFEHPGFSMTPEMPELGEVEVDHTPELVSGMYLTIRDNNYVPETFIVNKTDKIKLNQTSTGDLIAQEKPVYSTIERGDASTNGATWSRRNHWYHRSLVTFYHDNYQPVRATRPIVEFCSGLEVTNAFKENTFPLFKLYDHDGNNLATKYPEARFKGSRIFGTKMGTGAADSVLGYSVEWNSYGSIVFQDETSPAFEIQGLPKTQKFFKVNGKLRSNWLPAGTTKQTKGEEFWELPENLSTNSMNNSFADISENDWYSHFEEVLEKNDNYWSTPYGEIDHSVGSTIIQSRSSLLRLMLVSSDENLDIVKAMAYNEREYLRFRAKFNQSLSRAVTGGVVNVDPYTLTTNILSQLVVAKSKEFPFINSGVGGGEWHIPATATYLGCAPKYMPDITVDDMGGFYSLSVHGHDGSITRYEVPLPKIVETNDGSTNVIDTLDKAVIIGSAPVGVFRNDQRVLSLTYTRKWVDSGKVERFIQTDPMVWAKSVYMLEMMIYESSSFDLTINLHDLVSSAFRKKAYSRAEFLEVGRPAFEKWAALTNTNYRTNDIYNPDDKFTWNYTGAVVVGGITQAPAYWRGMYEYLFDTDRPHTHPWEMLGMFTKPSWWDRCYGWDSTTSQAPGTPKTRRQALVEALVAGVVSNPMVERVIDTNYARPESLISRIPVSSTGGLMNPVDCGLVLEVPTPRAAWVYGDLAPMENKWRKSYSASFIYALRCYLLRPAEFIEANWFANSEVYANGEWLRKPALDRGLETNAYVHNEIVDGEMIRSLGVQMWISDYLRSQGMDPTTHFGLKARNIFPKLSHKVGGFVDAKSLRAFTENIGMLNDGDVSTALYKSPPTREEFYSGVIVEKVESQWRVYGYNVVSPEFNVFKPYENSPRISISISSEPVVDPNPWMPGTYYTLNTKVVHDGRAYKAMQAHTSGSVFESEYWVQVKIPSSNTNHTVSWPTSFEPEATKITYGSVLSTKQEVADFLAGYQHYLESRGWIFDSYDQEVNETRDFRFSTKEFLLWASAVDLVDGMFIALSPASQEVKFKTPHGTVKNVEKPVNGTSNLVNREGFSIQSGYISANRSESDIRISSSGDLIYGARVYVYEIEHAIVFNNTTVFGDVLYDPTFGLRQYRIRISGKFSTNEWVGRMNAPGFIISDNTMTPNFDRSADDLRYVFGTLEDSSETLRDHARHLVGYQNRDYLSNLVQNEATQFEFYQGMIQQKGAPGAFNKILRNILLKQNHELDFLEEWAFRYGVYGGADRHKFFEFKLSKDEFKAEPQLVVNDVTSNSDSQEDQVVTLISGDDRWVIPAEGSLFQARDTFTAIKSALPTAGYVRVSDVDLVAFNINQLKDIGRSLPIFEKQTSIWIYRDDDLAWAVYRTLVNTPLQIIAVVPKGKVTTIVVDSPLVYNSKGEYVPSNVPNPTKKTKVGDIIFIDTKVDDVVPGLGGFHRVVGISPTSKEIDLDCVVAEGSVFDQTFDDMVDVVVFANRRIKSRNPDDFKRIQYAKGITVAKNDDTLHATLCAAMGITQVTELANGELLYVDVCYDLGSEELLPSTSRRWVVLEKQGDKLKVSRVQPRRTDSGSIADVRLINDLTVRSKREIISKPMINRDILVWDPVSGQVPGVAHKEITFKLGMDPASYNQGPSVTSSGSDWGYEQEGKLWWDISTAMYLDTMTDDISDIPSIPPGVSQKEYQDYLQKYAVELAEFKYRQANWGGLAPRASVDVYEWTKSAVPPSEWQSNFLNGVTPTVYDGEVYLGASANFVEMVEWDANLGRDVPIYFFWVKNRKSTPRKGGRRIPAHQVSQMLISPSSAGLSWVAPITTNSFLVGNLGSYATTTSNIEFKIATSDHDVNKHIEWKLMRDGDERGLPDYYLWSRMVTSLVGRNIWGDLVPNPSLPDRDKVGYDVFEKGQNMFADLKAARKHTVNTLNRILARIPVDASRSKLEALLTNEVDSSELQWVQEAGSYYLKPAPHHRLWVEKTDSADKLNHSVGAQLFYNLTPEESSWSVMSGDLWDATFYGDAQRWNTLTDVTWNTWNQGSWDFTENSEEWESFIWDGEVVSTAYNIVVDDMSFFSRQDFADPPVGMRVLVNNTFATGYWSIWEAKSSSLSSFELVQVQRYRSSDMWERIDWFAEGEDPMVPPYMEFNSESQIVAGLANLPSVSFIKVNNPVTSSWEWRRKVGDEWIVVARELGTLRLKDNVWENTGNFYTFPDRGDSSVYRVSDIQALSGEIKKKLTSRDMGYELGFMINKLREEVLTGKEVNQFFFSMVKYAHTEQDFIDWCFKTSFMYITGYSDQLRQVPIKYADLTSSVLDYIDEVKPYHVKIRDFKAKYRAPLEEVKATATDFDCSPFYNEKTGEVRVLNYLIDSDLQIIKNSPTHSGWWKATKPIIDLMASNASMRSVNAAVVKSGIRQLNLTRGNRIDEELSAVANEEIDINVTRENVDGDYHRLGYDQGVMFWRPAITAWEKVRDCHLHTTKPSTMCIYCCEPTVYDSTKAAKEHDNCGTSCKVKGTKTLSFFKLSHDGTVDYASAERYGVSYNWDEELWDEDEYLVGGDDKYIQRYLFAEHGNDTYTGPIADTNWDHPWNYDELMKKVTWNQSIDSYDWSIDENWLGATTKSEYGDWYSLSKLRLLAAKKYGSGYRSNAVILHVTPKKGSIFKMRIINRAEEQNDGDWLFHTSGGPIYQPL